MTPTFSIIIPVYNVAPYLRECLDSVLAAARTQSEKCEVRSAKCGVEEKIGGESRWTADVEIICVDDGSTDGSGTILDEYVEKVEKLGGGGQRSIKVLHQPNRGVSAARNAALDVATGEWLFFLDGDDIVTSSALVRLKEEIDRNPSVDVVRYAEYRFGNNNKQEDVGEIGMADVSREIPAEAMGGGTLLTWRNAMRRTRCGDVRFRAFVCGEDRLYTFECLQRADALMRIPDRLYGYRCRPESYTTSVIRTCRGIEGELKYRLAFLAVALATRKRVHYEGAGWLVNYLSREHLEGIMLSEGLTDGERRHLHGQWREALPYLMRCPVFSMWRRMNFALQFLLGAYRIQRMEVYLRRVVLGPDFWLRKLYRRVRHHGEFAQR